MASPTAIWVIVIVAMALLAFWLTAIMLADRSQVRASGRNRMTRETGPASDGAWAEGSVPGEQAAEVPGAPVHEPVGARGRHAREEPVPEGDIPTRPDLPAQPTGRHTVPAQPTGDADRAGRSYTGPLPPDEGETGR